MHKTQLQEKPWSEYSNDTSQNLNDSERVASALAGGALIAYGLKQGGLVGTTLSLLGGGLLLRGTTGHSRIYEAVGVNTKHLDGGSIFAKTPGIFSGKIHVRKAFTINKSAAELYQYWHNFENLPKFMRHLESVKQIDDKRSHWKAKAPLGITVEWDAEMTSDVQNEKIGWKSLDGSDIPNSGTVEFLPTANRGTEIKVTLTYEAPAGKLGEWTAWALGEEPSTQIAEDLRRFKMLMETGEIATIDGQTSGRAANVKPMTRVARA